MNYIFFDGFAHVNLLPLTFTKPVSELRVGILTIKEKWSKYLSTESFSYMTDEYLAEKFPVKITDDNVIINGSVLPSNSLASKVKDLQPNQRLIYNEMVVAARLNENQIKTGDFSGLESIDIEEGLDILTKTWDLFKKNDSELRKDFELLTSGKTSKALNSTNTVLGNNIFVEEGAKVNCAILNSQSGPIYIGKNTEIMEGSVIRGPFAMNEGAVLKLSSKIYGATTLGPYCKVGGEVNNSILQGYSNKGHDGFLGNSVIGEWCNLGADTNNSNLKNNYGNIKVWDYASNDYVNSGLQFCGLIMGDHSKTGINTMLNTGTVVGVNSNIFGGGFPKKYIPSFSWGGADGFTTFKLEKSYEVSERMMERRGVELTEADKKIMRHIFNFSTSKN